MLSPEALQALLLPVNKVQENKRVSRLKYLKASAVTRMKIVDDLHEAGNRLANNTNRNTLRARQIEDSKIFAKALERKG